MEYWSKQTQDRSARGVTVVTLGQANRTTSRPSVTGEPGIYMSEMIKKIEENLFQRKKQNHSGTPTYVHPRNADGHVAVAAKWRLGRENPGKDGRRFHFPRMRLICMFWLRILTSDLSTLVLILSS